jgi:tetratricopeptide (TPR) repeat protein
MQLRNFGLAMHILSVLKDKKPQDFAILHNLGLAEISLAPYSGEESYLDRGEEHLRKALKKTPEACQTINGLAQIYLHRGNWQACLEYCEKSLKIKPEQAGLQETYGMASLALGKYEQGFKNVDAHIPSLTRKPKPLNNEPYWDGAKGVKLFVQGEQGLGDEISFASVVYDAARDNEIALECDSRLEGLFRRSLPVPVYGTRNQERDWDFEPDAMCLSGTLATHYRKRPEDFPRKAFLIADDERRVQWKALLDTLPGKKVGIAWKGGVPMNFSGRRSTDLSALHSLLKTPGITWVSLEYRDPSDEIEAFRRKNPGVNIVHWERAVGKGVDYDETAALVSELDAVVSVCTSVVHLCGALGKTCHVLVPKVPRWFYESKTQDHAWYESLVLHREDKDWPLEKIRCALLSTSTTQSTPLAAFAP